MAHYIIQLVGFQFLFLIIYDVFLKNETFFSCNRIYLLSTALLSMMLPFIKVHSFKALISDEYVIALPEVVLGQGLAEVQGANAFEFTLFNATWSYLHGVFLLGVFVATIIFLIKIAKIFILINRNPNKRKAPVVFVKLGNSNVAYSFFNFIFLGTLLNPEDEAAVIRHELVHVKQWHSLDLLFFELLRIVFWFSPMVYMYQKRVMTLHEFLADSGAVRNHDKSKYYQNLLSQIFETKNISFINPFFKQSLIKKRIVMLQKSKSKQVNLLKFTLLIPVVLGMLFYTSCQEEPDAKVEVHSNQDSKSAVEMSETQELFLKEKEKFKNATDVPFSLVDQVPVFPGCEDAPIEEQRDCISKTISMFVNNNFNTEVANSLNLKGRQRVNVMFKLNTDGQVVEVASRASHPKLEAEAIRVIEALPVFKPGMNKGKPVNVLYSLPIIFKPQS
ncbi:M56 family metallopeptidase [Tamlana agarivorans]|uniref:M56 family metallopeptidase n=1 Tax=Pseudotamlana agarivorans TaxID=481183 RepID=A0ACC5U6N7_9FLAO|nr:M56 family metallopeptidase [Tamlana agarivorans]MBU2949964.1 M56 family metallopeptidase [Tamlana agarivorans]